MVHQVSAGDLSVVDRALVSEPYVERYEDFLVLLCVEICCDEELSENWAEAGDALRPWPMLSMQHFAETITTAVRPFELRRIGLKCPDLTPIARDADALTGFFRAWLAPVVHAYLDWHRPTRPREVSPREAWNLRLRARGKRPLPMTRTDGTPHDGAEEADNITGDGIFDAKNGILGTGNGIFGSRKGIFAASDGVFGSGAHQIRGRDAIGVPDCDDEPHLAVERQTAATQQALAAALHEVERLGALDVRVAAEITALRRIGERVRNIKGERGLKREITAAAVAAAEGALGWGFYGVKQPVAVRTYVGRVLELAGFALPPAPGRDQDGVRDERVRKSLRRGASRR